MTISAAYKRYPFRIPLRVKFWNLFRLIFRNAFLERFLISRIAEKRWAIWRKLIPPLYFYPEGSTREARRDNISFRLDISKQLEHSIYFFSISEPGWQRLFQMLRADFKIIDAGANIGYLTLHFAKCCTRGMIYAFEPDAESFSKLKHNVMLNKLDNIRLFNIALGAQKGTGELYRLYKSNPGANRILGNSPPGSVPSEHVNIDTLDDLVAEGHIDRVDLIKIDVEGFELFVLEGARKLIGDWMPLLYIELVDENLRGQGCTSRDVLDFLNGLNYSVRDAKTMKPLGPSDNYYCDILCFPDDSGRNHA